MSLTNGSSTTQTTQQEALIVVSNRLPFVLKRNEETGKLERKSSAGGLVTAVAPVVVRCQGLWVGWPGIHLDDVEHSQPIPESEPEDKTPTAGLLAKQVVPVNIDKGSFDAYYNGCCNGTFWPLFHSMPDRAIFSAESWNAYGNVNLLFAEKTFEAMERLAVERPGVIPLVWIHDYHLMLAASIIRQMAQDHKMPIKLGFFLHIPFPPWDIFRLFPWDDEVLQGLLGCDMIGFHIEDYCLNFIDCCQRRLGCRVDRKNMLVEHGARTAIIRALPIGIPFDRFVQLAQEAPRVVKTDEQHQVVLGVDRLDYTKGLVHRLRSYERLLEKHPELVEKVTLLQIAVPSRTDVKEYQDLKEEIDQKVGSINGRFSTANWSPIRYIFGCVTQAELAAFYRDASVALVTPLRDGMNLVAKEFVACQIEEPGVLILSPFAGAGEMMHEALIVNPYEVEEASDTIYRALTMPRDEREVRMSQLRRREKRHDVDYWMQCFLKAIGSTGIMETGGVPFPTTAMQPVSLDDFEYLAKYLGDADKLALLLDYDGTLAAIAPHPDLAIIPNETKRVLERLTNMSDVFIAVISGRDVNNVKAMVGIDSITYAGNHGLEILHPDGTKFVHPLPAEYERRVNDLSRVLQEEVCHDGAWVENKGVLLTFHYRETPFHKRAPLIARARQLIEQAGFKVGPAHCALEAKPPVQWDKGRAAIYILRTAFGVDWNERVRIIYVGDDATDEDAMTALKGMAATFRVTTNQSVKTAADKRLPDPDAVLALLKWVERHSSRRKPRASLSLASPPVDIADIIKIDIANLPEPFDAEEGQLKLRDQ